MFLGYLRRRAGDIAVIAVCAVIFAAVFRLFGIEAAAVRYGAALCGAFFAVFAAADYILYRRRVSELEEIKSRITISCEGLPKTKDGVVSAFTGMVTELYGALRSACDEAERRKRNDSEYYTLWVHQIKTPIAAMRLILSESDTEEAHGLLEGLFRIEQYVDMVMAKSRLESDTTDYLLKEYLISDIARSAIRKFAPQFIRKKIKMNFDVPDVPVVTDSKWLGFVVGQVLSNALKYTNEGSVSVYLEKPLTLVIRDTGIGISPEDLPRIFESGYTGSAGRLDRKASGIGLGLCRAVCGRLGHVIRAESEVGVGTAVYIGLDRRRTGAE